MKKSIIYTIIIVFVGVLFSCEKQKFSKTSYETKPEFSWAFAQFYGDYYSNYKIKNNVLTLHFFTKDLKLVDGHLVGRGQYLILEDVFLAPKDTLLQKGNYLPKETGEPFSFFSGKYFSDNNNDENPSGAYLYYIEEGRQSLIKLIKKGKIDVNIINQTIYSIDMNFKTSDNISIVGTYKNTIPHLDMLLKKDQKKNRIIDN